MLRSFLELGWWSPEPHLPMDQRLGQEGCNFFGWELSCPIHSINPVCTRPVASILPIHHSPSKQETVHSSHTYKLSEQESRIYNWRCCIYTCGCWVCPNHSSPVGGQQQKGKSKQRWPSSKAPMASPARSGLTQLPCNWWRWSLCSHSETFAVVLLLLPTLLVRGSECGISDS